MDKETLLNTGYFIDNNYLDSYLELISKKYPKKNYMEKHHILPRSYFKITKQKIDNSKENIIYLSYYNHILAHYYLSLCTINKLRLANIGAFMMLTEIDTSILAKSEKKALEELEHIAAIKELARADKIKTCKQLGSKQKSAKHKEALKKARDLHSTTKGKKSIYNINLNKVKFVAEHELSTYLADGWVLGGKPLSKEAKQKISKSNSIALSGKKHQTIPSNKLNSGLTFNKVKCIETGQVFENILEAKCWLQKTVGIDGGQIKNCCAGARETTGGYHWEYIKEN